MEQLQRAALEGNTELLREIHRKNPLLIHRVLPHGSFNETPLHAAVLLGHFEFTRELLRLKQEFAEALDSRQMSPLHLASAKGNVEIVRELVRASREMCAAQDRDGLNPLHYAAINGKVEVLSLLFEARPDAVRHRTGQGDTILHLCVKHGQKEALDLLIERVNDDGGFVNAKDAYGYTILLLAVADKQVQIVKYLVDRRIVDVNAKTANGYTAMDILVRSRRDVHDWDIMNSLQEAGAIKSRGDPQPSIGRGFETELPKANPKMLSFLCGLFSLQRAGLRTTKQADEWVTKNREALLVVATLMATMAFQAGLNPPGGVWQDASPLSPSGSPAPDSHRAGEAVVAFNYMDSYKFYLAINTVSFVASLSTIQLLVSGLPYQRKIFMWILMVIMWVSISATAFTYAFSITAVTPEKDRPSLRKTMYVAVTAWCVVTVLMFLGHIIHLIGKWLKKMGVDLWDSDPVRRISNRSIERNHDTGCPGVQIQMQTMQ